MKKLRYNRAMKIIFFGTPDFVAPILESLQNHFEIVAVITAPDKKVGRKQILTPSPIKVRAEEHGIKVFQPESLKSITEDIKELSADLFVVAAYGKIIPQAILDLPKHGAINIHPSLLPKYRGSTPIQTALKDGERHSGVSFILMDEQMDHGPLLQTIPFKFSDTDTSEWLLQSMFKQSAIVIPSVIGRYISGELKPEKQDDSAATYTKMLEKQDGYIDLKKQIDPQIFDQMVRAYYPWPNVWSIVAVNGKELRIKFLPEKQIQVEGKQVVSLKDFLNGYPELRKIIEPLYSTM